MPLQIFSFGINIHILNGARAIDKTHSMAYRQLDSVFICIRIIGRWDRHNVKVIYRLSVFWRIDDIGIREDAYGILLLGFKTE